MANEPMLVITAGDIQGRRIVRYLGMVTGEAITKVALDGYGYRWLRVRPAGDLAIP